MFFRTERSVKEFLYAYPVVFTIIALNLSLWVITHLLPFEFGKELYLWGAGNNYIIYAYGEYWRFLTPIFLHAEGLSHVLLNSIALIIFAPALEQMLGKIKFPLMYLLAGILGNIGTYLVDMQSLTYHIGASGSVYGLFGIYIFMVFFRKDLIDQASAQLIITISAVGMLTTFIIPGINIYAHLFGFIAGLLIAPLFLTKARPFSVHRNKRPPAYQHSSGVAFDPNRWQKRRFIPKFIRDNSVIFIFLLIVIIVFLAGL